MDEKARKEQMRQAVEGLPPDLLAMVAPLMASGSYSDLLPVLRHVHFQIGMLIQKLEGVKIENPGPNSGKKRKQGNTGKKP